MEVAPFQSGGVGGVARVHSLPQFLGLDFQRVVLTGLEFSRAFGVDVEAGDFALFAKFNRQGQAHVTQADDGHIAVVCEVFIFF